MKKLTALLLGTVIGIAFTASDAFADNPVMKYLKSDDGNKGVYLGFTYDQANIPDITADYLRNTDDGTAPSEWQIEDGKGFKIVTGMDFGKLRVDWRLGAIHSRVTSIDNAALEAERSDHAVFAYSTFNVALDLYRFQLIDRGIIDIAITPYVEGGYGYGGGWMTGKKNADGGGANTKRDAGGIGQVHSYGGGALLNLTSFAGITAGYTKLNMNFGKGEEVGNHITEVGLRLTF